MSYDDLEKNEVGGYQPGKEINKIIATFLLMALGSIVVFLTLMFLFISGIIFLIKIV